MIMMTPKTKTRNMIRKKETIRMKRTNKATMHPRRMVMVSRKRTTKTIEIQMMNQMMIVMNLGRMMINQWKNRVHQLR